MDDYRQEVLASTLYEVIEYLMVKEKDDTTWNQLENLRFNLRNVFQL